MDSIIEIPYYLNKCLLLSNTLSTTILFAFTQHSSCTGAWCAQHSSTAAAQNSQLHFSWAMAPTGQSSTQWSYWKIRSWGTLSLHFSFSLLPLFFFLTLSSPPLPSPSLLFPHFEVGPKNPAMRSEGDL